MKKLGLIGILMVAVAGSARAQQEPPKPPAPEIPANLRPPKGMCRIWLKDVPPAQQPAPTDCAAAVKNCPANGTVIFADKETKEKPKSEPKVEPKSYTGGKKPPLPLRFPIKPPIL